MGQTRSTNLYFQALRGLAILAVVLIHAYNSRLPAVPGDQIANLVLRQWINFAVPLFLFIAGYFVNQGEASDHPRAYLSRRLVKLLPPYLLWSAVGILLSGDYSCTIFLRLVTGTAFFQLYFIVVLIQLTLLTPLIVRATHHSALRRPLFLVTPLSVCAYYLVFFASGNEIPYRQVPFFTWFIFYYYGILVRGGHRVYPTVKLSWNLAAYVIAVALSIFEGAGIYRATGVYSLTISQIKISSFCASFFFINIVLLLEQKLALTRRNPLVVLGHLSSGIFYVHVVFMLAVWRVEETLNGSNGLPDLVLVWVIVLSLSSLTVWLGRKILGEKLAGSILGF